MRVEVKTGGDGVRCWNVAAIQTYAQTMNEREALLAQRNPDLTVKPGVVSCYGCEVMEYDYGIKCTAQLTRTRYAVQGETEPRAEDAAGSLLEIPGLLTRAPSEVEPEPANAGQTTASSGPPATSAGAHATAPESKRSGLRGLFGR